MLSRFWEEHKPAPFDLNNLLNHRTGQLVGMGLPQMTDDEYVATHKKWTERYRNVEDIRDWPEPSVGNPVLIDGYSVPYIKNFALAKVFESLFPYRDADILEIGAGYGGMAEVLLKRGVARSYTVIDIPESLAVSEWYLTQVTDKPLEFYSPDQLNEIQKSYDGVFNASSFGEMPLETAQDYLDRIPGWLRPDGVLISHNGVKRVPEGAQKPSDYRWPLKLQKVIGQPNPAGILHDQHLVMVLGREGEEVDVDHLSRWVNMGLHNDLQHPFVCRLFESGWYRAYLLAGKSLVARAIAKKLAGLPLGDSYIEREAEGLSSAAIKAKLGRA